MSAVKNLRAMFEQKGETSPPDRGRSPGIPHGPGTDSPRPLSKVRTSFIAVEKDGRIGLQREGSQDSISAFRKQSGDSAVTTPTAATEKSNPFDYGTKSPLKTTLQTQPMFGLSRADSFNRDGAAPAANPAPHAPLQQSQPAKLEPSPIIEAQTKNQEANEAVDKEATPESGPLSQDEAPKTNGTGSVKEPHEATGKETGKPATHTKTPAPKPLKSHSSKISSKPEKSPTLHKTPKTPTTASAHHPVAKKTPDKKPQPHEKPSTPRAIAPPAKAAGTPLTKRPPPLQASPATSTGFVKPKPKSPTRPVKLPPSLTTHTASSGSKVNASRQSLSRASGATGDAHGRPASRASTVGSATHKPAPAKTLRRQNSTINRPRPSLGPPPKQPAKDHPPTKKEKEVDQGFLARMMRPTQSSASKATEKVHASPPRKTAAAASKKLSTAKPVKKILPKSAVHPSSTAKPHGSTAKQVAADAEHAATADEATEKAKAAEGEVLFPAEADQRSSAQEVASVVEQSETVEQVVTAVREVGNEPAASQVSEATAAVEEPAKACEPEPAAPAEEPPAPSHDDKTGAAATEPKKITSPEALASTETTETTEKKEKEGPEMTPA
ncbi:hypothetical protein VTI74DRAFT_7998 [Chaetomium olivicolor]